MSMSKKISVLVVEDDTMVMKIIIEFIKKINYLELVGKAYDIKSAKTILNSQKVDLVLLDMYLPDGTGINLLKWIRMEDVNADCIMITADHKSSTLEKALRYGMEDYLVKPFKYERFKSAIEAFKKKKTLLSNYEDVEQDMIDDLLSIETAPQNLMLKNQTYEHIITFLSEHQTESYTSSEIAKQLGISRITARKYLELMEDTNEVILELSYGNVGRPKNKYRINGERVNEI